MSTEMTPPAAPADRNDETMPITEMPFDETAPTDVAAAQPAPPAPPASPAASAAVAVEPAAPRVRGAAIIWGLLFAVIAFAGIWTLTGDDRRSAAADAITTLTPGTVVALGLLALGVLVLVSGAVGLVRHAQRRAAASRP
ncbi:hypothetical protein SRABI76_02455 [Microbacterium oxydans]|uniref:hypothetical protein n=1 Tax=Microbacterium oxydans TaxID=82380 RepID=UPI001D5C12A1|nr:hypothetical protein [Microbacterium oxydans]CAH0218823.1 hypothetical protein SRABI76_02455 [Microbacterium oxydans]